MDNEATPSFWSGKGPFYALAWIGGFAALDVWRTSKHDGSAVSQLNRAVFSMHTPAGRRRFIVAWTIGSAIYYWHLCSK